MRTWTFATGLLLIAIVLAPLRTRAAEEIKPVVARDELTPLLSAFSAAQPLSDKILKSVEGRVWQCELYGLRSRMLAQSGLKLYKLEMEAPGKFKNLGSQVIRQYEASEQGMSGRNGALREELKLATNGHLMGEMVTVSGTQITKIALSDCR